MSWRWSDRTTGLVLLGWAVAAILLCREPVAWVVEYVSDHHPDLAIRFFGLVALLAAGLPVVYQLLLRRRLWRHEPLILAGTSLAFCLAYEPLATIVCLLLVVSAFSVGRFSLERLGLRPEGPVAEISLSTGLGLAWLSWILFFVGMAGGYRDWVFVAMLVFPLAVLHRQFGALWGTLRLSIRRWRETEELGRPIGALLIVVLVALAASGLLVMLAPTITFDALKFHLPLAQHYADAGAVDLLDFEVYSYYPQGVEVLMTVGAALAGQAGGQMIPVIFLPLTLAMLFAVLRRAGIGRLGALAGVVFAAAVPYMHWTGVNPKNDLAIAFYHLAALWCYLRWREDRRFRWILVGVFFIAAACCVKLPALFGLVALFPLYVFGWWRQPHRVRNAAVTLLILCLFGIVWQVRTWSLTGNPVYPHGVAESAAVGPLTAVTGPPTQPAYGTVPTRVWGVLFDGWGFASDQESPLGMAVVVLLPLLLLIRGKREARACWVFVAVCLVYWVQFVPVLRFAIAPVSILIGMLGARAAELSSARARGLRFFGYAASSFVFLYSLSVTFILEINEPQFAYFARRSDKGQFLLQALRTYPVLEYLRGRAGEDEAVFGVGNCSRAYAPDPELFTCEYAPPTPEGIGLLSELIALRDYRYLILPAEPGYESLLDAISTRAPLERIYDDSAFQVFETTTLP